MKERGDKDLASHWNSKNICFENIRTGVLLQKSSEKNSSELKLETMKKLSWWAEEFPCIKQTQQSRWWEKIECIAKEDARSCQFTKIQREKENNGVAGGTTPQILFRELLIINVEYTSQMRIELEPTLNSGQVVNYTCQLGHGRRQECFESDPNI